jgi:hypothetical protein
MSAGLKPGGASPALHGNFVASFPLDFGVHDLGFDEGRGWTGRIGGSHGLSAGKELRRQLGKNAEQKRTRAGMPFMMASSITDAFEANQERPLSP